MKPKKTDPLWTQDAVIIGDSSDRTYLDTARFLNPATVTATLQGANSGDPVQHRQLHLIMRRTWPALRNCLEQIRDAANECDWQTSPWQDAEGNVPDEAKKRQAVVDAALFGMKPRQGYLEGTLTDFLANAAEATLYAPTAYELLWSMGDRGQGMQAVLTGIKTLPAHYTIWRAALGQEDAFLFRRAGNRGGSMGEEWPENQFAVQMPGTLDHPSLSAVLDTLSFWWVAAVYGPKWLIRYVEKYGVPFMWANYATGNASDRNAAIAALRTLGNAGYGAFPAGTQFNISQPAAGSYLPQQDLIKLADQICQQAILGTDLTTSTKGEGSLALGKVHKDGQSRRERARLRTAAGLVESQIIPAILRLTFGDEDYAPSFRHGDEDEEDLGKTADLLDKAKALGVRIPRQYAHEVLSIPVPVSGEEVIGDDPPDPPDPPDPTDPEKATAAARAAAAELPAGAADFVSELQKIIAATLENAAAAGAALVTETITSPQP